MVDETGIVCDDAESGAVQNDAVKEHPCRQLLLGRLAMREVHEREDVEGGLERHGELNLGGSGSGARLGGVGGRNEDERRDGFREPF